MDKAIEYLKLKGLAMAEKKSVKEAHEGAVGIILSKDRKSASLIEVIYFIKDVM